MISYTLVPMAFHEMCGESLGTRLVKLVVVMIMNCLPPSPSGGLGDLDLLGGGDLGGLNLGGPPIGTTGPQPLFGGGMPLQMGGLPAAGIGGGLDIFGAGQAPVGLPGHYVRPKEVSLV